MRVNVLTVPETHIFVRCKGDENDQNKRQQYIIDP